MGKLKDDEAGYNAFFDGIDREENPFATGSIAARNWYGGWDEAKSENAARNAAGTSCSEPDKVCPKDCTTCPQQYKNMTRSDMLLMSKIGAHHPVLLNEAMFKKIEAVYSILFVLEKDENFKELAMHIRTALES